MNLFVSGLCPKAVMIQISAHEKGKNNRNRTGNLKKLKQHKIR
jgi:hypothetical protein